MPHRLPGGRERHSHRTGEAERGDPDWAQRLEGHGEDTPRHSTTADDGEGANPVTRAPGPELVTTGEATRTSWAPVDGPGKRANTAALVSDVRVTCSPEPSPGVTASESREGSSYGIIPAEK